MRTLTFSLAALCAGAANAQNPDYYAAGLIQAKYTGVNFAQVCASNVLASAGAERVLGAVMADVYAGNDGAAASAIYVNPLTGNPWTWGSQNSGFGYVGEMHVVSNVTYTFGKYLDDAARIVIDGQNVIDSTTYSDWKTGAYTATNTGWVAFDARIHDGSGGKGPTGGAWGTDLGLAFNTNGHAAMAPKEYWTKLLDPGDMSLFRAPMFAATPHEPAFTVLPVVSVSGGGFALEAVLAHGAGDVCALAGFDGGYAHTNFIGAAAAGVPVSGAFENLASNTMFTAAVLATNAWGETAFMASSTPFYTGVVRLEKVRDADEEGFVTGVINVWRGNTVEATRLPLAVNYACAGAGGNPAVEGVNYAAPSGSVTIPAGADVAQIIITPLLDLDSAAGTGLLVSLLPGLYFNDPAPVSVEIAKWAPDPYYNTWIASPVSDGLASTAANWSQGAPKSGDHILLGAFSSMDMVWDYDGANGLTNIVAGWTQDASYTGTVTFNTQYPGVPGAVFTNFTVTGNVEVSGGAWTHPANGASEVYRLRVDAGANFTLGEGASINVQYKGHGVNQPHPGSALGIHGGSRNNFAHVYGDVREPVNLGSGGYNHAGGGAVYLTVAGNAEINGLISADSFQTSSMWSGEQGGAGGSIYLRAASISGSSSGFIQANGTPAANNNASSGGRVALVTTSAETLGFPLANVSARGNSGGEYMTAGGGTVLVKTAVQEHGTLLIDNTILSFSGHPMFFAGTTGTTCVPPGQSWTNDAVITRNHGILSIPEGATLVLPNGFASVTSPDTGVTDGILYLGGDIILGVGAPHVIHSNWVFHAHVPYTFDGDVHVVNQGALGCLPLRNTLASHSKSEYTINGSLLVDASSRVTAVRAGVDWDDANQHRAASHGGQAAWRGGNGWEEWIADARAYGSILNPVTPGIFGADYTNIARDSRNPGGGAVVLRVRDTFELNGAVDASAPEYNYERAGGAGGSINVTAGNLAGTGKMDVSGYRSSNESKYGGGAGRIAVRLTAPGADFNAFDEAAITARGFSVADSARAYIMTSAGTVYLETAADGPGGGTVKIWNGGVTNNIAFTPFPSKDYGGDGDVFTGVRLDIGQAARVKLFDSVRLREVLTREDTQLDLNGETLTVRAAVIGGRRVGQSGRHSAAALQAMLDLDDATITDTSAGRDGFLEIRSPGTVFMLR